MKVSMNTTQNQALKLQNFRREVDIVVEAI